MGAVAQREIADLGPHLVNQLSLAQSESFDWRTDFKSFTLIHLVTVAAFAGAMIASCWLGRRWRDSTRERRFRLAWGWIILIYQTWYTAWYFMPYRFDWRDSLPLQLCDLAAFIAGLAMVTGWRPWRSLLYFWGIGLSTQAFFTPTLQFGVMHIKFWMFWVGHTMIVGSAVYDVVVGGYRPRFKDLMLVLAATYMLCMSIFYMDVLLTDLVGTPINYWYIGPSKPLNPTLIDRLGPWPLRVAMVIGIVVSEFVLLWAIWPIAARLTGRADPLSLVCPACGAASTRPGEPCPRCGAAPTHAH